LNLLVLTGFIDFLESDWILISLSSELTVFNFTIQFLTVRFQTKKELGLFIFYDLIIMSYSSIKRPGVIKVFLRFPIR